MRNDTHLFYSGDINPTADFADNYFQLQLGSTRMVKAIASGGVAELSFNNGRTVDVELKDGEEINLDDFQTQKISVRGAATSVRIWSY